MSSANEMSFRQAADRLYDALNALFAGDLTPMRGLWSHADDVAYMGDRAAGSRSAGNRC